MHLFKKLLFYFLSFTIATGASTPTKYAVDEYRFDADIDHYNYQLADTFPLRFFVNDQHFNNATGAVFFYAGNENNIVHFVNHSGFLFELAEKLSGMVVFAEHRYYGLSHPFGGYEYSLQKGYNISFLTVEQAMQDYNTLTVHIRQKWNLKEAIPFVVLGGSYGANLALWLRLKNPNVWAGAIASSPTPLKHLLRETNEFTKIETDVYSNVSQLCPDLVRQGWKELETYLKETAGKRRIKTELGLCQEPDANDFGLIHGWISDALETMVQYGYPYETNVYGPVPAYPFAVTCFRMLNVTAEETETNRGLKALRQAVNVFYNYTGQIPSCYSLQDDALTRAARYLQRQGQYDNRLLKLDSSQRTDRSLRATIQNINNPAPELVMRAWSYQCCTEVYQPMPTTGITDFEVPYTPNWTDIFLQCQSTWNVTPRPYWEELTFMGGDIWYGSNMFITNGQLDPWRAAGIQKVPAWYTGSIVVRNMEGAAHHLDLRASHPDDPLDVKSVRMEQERAIQQWIQEWIERHRDVSANGSGRVEFAVEAAQ